MRRRLAVGLRLALLAGVLLAAVGTGGRVADALGVGTVLGTTWLTAALGPTA